MTEVSLSAGRAAQRRSHGIGECIGRCALEQQAIGLPTSEQLLGWRVNRSSFTMVKEKQHPFTSPPKEGKERRHLPICQRIIS
jgi:hypothetical protein